MKVIFIGCVQFSLMALKTVLSCREATVVGVVTKQASSFNADFCSLDTIAIGNNIPFFYANADSYSDMVQWIRSLGPDVIYCFGWSSLLRRDVLDIPPKGVIGYHPAALPQNRGRHPIIWSLALGLAKTASTFFFMDEGADSGDILSQQEVLIEDIDDANSLYNKLCSVASGQIRTFTEDIALGTYSRSPQDSSKANYWRKRSKADGQIDWRMSANCINNLVRALTKPYVGAHFIYNGEEVKIWKAEIVENEFCNIEPGKVIEVRGEDILIKCGEGALLLTKHECRDLPKRGDYL